MKSLRFFLLVICLTGQVCLSQSDQNEQRKLLRAKVHQELENAVSGVQGILGLVAHDLTTGEQFAFNEEQVFPQGSAIKIPILMVVYEQAQAGKLDLSERLWVEERHKVGGSGILNELGNHSVQLSIRDLAVLMIVLSDNTATNMLIELVGMETINTGMTSLGLSHTKVQRLMMDTAARGRGDENLSNPAEAARIMEILYRGEFLSRQICDEILEILQKPKEGSIPAGLPAEVPVAFKPGGIPGVSTEWALVNLPERPYILVLMGNYGVEDEFKTVFPQISRILHQYYVRLGRATHYGTYVDPGLIK